MTAGLLDVSGTVLSAHQCCFAAWHPLPCTRQLCDGRSLRYHLRRRSARCTLQVGEDTTRRSSGNGQFRYHTGAQNFNAAVRSICMMACCLTSGTLSSYRLAGGVAVQEGHSASLGHAQLAEEVALHAALDRSLSRNSPGQRE